MKVVDEISFPLTKIRPKGKRHAFLRLKKAQGQNNNKRLNILSFIRLNIT